MIRVYEKKASENLLKSFSFSLSPLCGFACSLYLLYSTVLTQFECVLMHLHRTHCAGNMEINLTDLKSTEDCHILPFESKH